MLHGCSQIYDWLLHYPDDKAGLLACYTAETFTQLVKARIR